MLLALSVLLLISIADSHPVTTAIDALGSWGWIGVVITGMFFTSTFTVAPSAIALYQLAHTYDPLVIAMLGGLGAMLGDMIIFRTLKDSIFVEWEPIFHYLGESHIMRTLHTPFFAWFAPVMGALVIASPLPDELGIGLLGIAKLKTWEFLLISFVMNSLGVLMIVGLAGVF